MTDAPSRVLLRYQSAQSLHVEMQFEKQKLSIGTAFVIKRKDRAPLLITNRHNVTGRHQQTGKPLSPTLGIPDRVVVAFHQHGRTSNWVEVPFDLRDPNGSPTWIEHPTLKQQADFVALRLPPLRGIDLYPYLLDDLGPDIFIGPAEPVSVIGFPMDIRIDGFVPVWANGTIASEPALNVDGLPVFLIDCRTRPGQSGSPVIAYRSGAATGTNGAFMINTQPIARFLGIYSGRVHKDSDLGMVWKASAIAELVDSVTPDFSIQGSSYINRA